MLLTETQLETVGGDSRARTVHRKKKKTKTECPYTERKREYIG